MIITFSHIRCHMQRQLLKLMKAVTIRKRMIFATQCVHCIVILRQLMIILAALTMTGKECVGDERNLYSG